MVGTNRDARSGDGMVMAFFDLSPSRAKRQEAAGRGVLFAAGTGAPYPGVFQGEAIHHELELLLGAGMPPLPGASARDVRRRAPGACRGGIR